MNEPPCENFLRGIRKSSWTWTIEGNLVVVSWEAFLPDEKTAQSRDDRWAETSVTWEISSDALHHLFGDRTISEHGAARLLAAKVTEISTGSVLSGTLSMEYRPLPANPYHGNVLFAASLPKPAKRMLAAGLALHAQFVDRPAR